MENRNLSKDISKVVNETLYELNNYPDRSMSFRVKNNLKKLLKRDYVSMEVMNWPKGMLLRGLVDYCNASCNASLNTPLTSKVNEEIKGVPAYIEQDSTGRYINISIEGKKYALTTNTITDQDAYEDAMNQYEYDKATYDKAIEDINAKIAIIQAEDKDLELRLKQLDTEHNAVSNEKEAVSKVIQKAVESGFKTFG